MPMNAVRGNALRDAETGETGENSENNKNGDKGKNLGTNLT